MNNWAEVKLGELGEKIALGPFGSNIKVETFKPFGIPIISGGHLHQTRLQEESFNYISVEHADRLLNSNVYRGDVIFTHAGNVGQVSFIPENSKYERYIISQRQFYLRCNRLKLDHEYITYYFKSSLGQHQLLSNVNQTGVPSLAQPGSYLKQLVVKVPPLPEQKAIAAVLSSLDDKIDLLHRQNKTLEAMAETLFRQWFVEEAQEDWEEKSLLDLIELVGGGTPKTSMAEYWDGDIPWLAGGDIATHHKGFVSASEKTITNAGLENSSAKLLPKFATVVSARGTVGKYCLLAGEMAFSQSNYGILPRIKGCYFFTYLLMNHVVEELQSAAYGSVFDTITTSTFREAKFAVPPVAKVLEFEDFTASYFDKKLVNQTQIRTLEKLRDTLLPKLMSGEVRVAQT